MKLALAILSIVTFAVGFSLGKRSIAPAKEAASFCVNNEVNGLILVEPFSCSKLTRISDGAQRSLPISAEEIAKDNAPAECPK